MTDLVELKSNSTAWLTVAVLIVSFNIISCLECCCDFSNIFESLHE